MAKQIGVLTAGGDSPGPQRRNVRSWQVRHTNPRHVTILGHVQRGGTPSPADRIIATRLGTACADFIANGISGVMVAMRNGECVPVPLKEVAGRRKTVPLDHPWLLTARNLGVGLGD